MDGEAPSTTISPPTIHETECSQSNKGKQKHSRVPLQEPAHSKTNVKKSTSSFRLPGKTKHREGKVKRKPSQPANTPSISLTTQPDAGNSKRVESVRREFSTFGLLNRDARKSHHQGKRLGQRQNACSTYAPNSLLPSKPVFGVPLELAFERNPSHDGVVLPAFLRFLIDYIELYGLSTEGIYRVPGVNSHVQSIVAALDRGEEFPAIPPTLDTHYQHSHIGNNSSDRHLPLTAFSPGLNAKLNHAGQSHLRHTEVEPFSPDSKLYSLPHEVYVVASVLKQFLRNLPEPVLTNHVGQLMESINYEAPQVYHTLAALVHKQMPVAHRFLLAWLLQHMNNIIHRSRENLMSLSNISIVLSPSLNISHRLLAVLLSPPRTDITIDLFELDPSLPPLDDFRSPNLPSESCFGHWLFPHPIYHLRPYHPPLDPVHAMDLPESDEQLDEELHKQESLLLHLHAQLSKGESCTEKENLLWEVQRLVTELRRRKSLCTPESIRVELERQQTQLDRLHATIAAEQSRSPKQIVDALKSPTGQQILTSKHDVVDLSHYPHCDELWELQRQVTMLKRRLKRQEKRLAPQTHSVSSSTVPSANQVIISGGIPFEIPSVDELDQEEVLNLTLRKLSVVPTVGVTSNSAADKHPATNRNDSVSTFKTDECATLPEETNWVDQSPSLWPQPADVDSNISCNDAESTPQSLFVDGESIDTSDHLHTDEEEEEVGEKEVEQSDIKLVSTTLSATSPEAEEIPIEPAHPTDERVSPTTPGGTVDKLSDASSTSVHAQQPPTVVDKQSQQQLLHHVIRKQELQAINADLCARIRSENAEIQRIQSSIDRLLERGEQSVHRTYEHHFAAALLGHKSTSSSTTPTNTKLTGHEHCSAWLDQSWVKLVAQLDANEIDLRTGDGVRGEEEDSLLIDSPDESSHNTSDPDIDSCVVSYSRLIDEDDDDAAAAEADEVRTPEDYNSESMTDHQFKYATLPTDNENEIEVNVADEDDDDDDDDDEECEAELARTLHQLVLDNARLEQLNSRYLEGIQAERNRCVELKVLLKLRNNNTDPTTTLPVSTAV